MSVSKLNQTVSVAAPSLWVMDATCMVRPLELIVSLRSDPKNVPPVVS